MRQVDRMSLELKWQLLPLLLVPKPPSPRPQPYQSFRQLVNIERAARAFQPSGKWRRRSTHEACFADLITGCESRKIACQMHRDMIRTLNELTSGRTSIPSSFRVQILSEVRAVRRPNYRQGLSPRTNAAPSSPPLACVARSRRKSSPSRRRRRRLRFEANRLKEINCGRAAAWRCG